LQILRLIATLRLEPAKMELIAGFMENYLALNAREELDFQASLDKIEDSKQKNRVMQLMTSWERKGRQEGRKQGRREGLEEGRDRGLLEGQVETVKRQLRVLFGRITSAQAKRIDSLEDKKISDLAEALLNFSSARDLENWLSQKGLKPR
jgi:flagellar biosynthesis/type III secretory pathway protein FliH